MWVPRWYIWSPQQKELEKSKKPPIFPCGTLLTYSSRIIWEGMVDLDIDVIFNAALHIQLNIEKTISINFSESGVSIKFPTTRRLAEFLDVPHYYVLPYFAMMEKDALVTRAERVGIMTTPKGTRKLIELMSTCYRRETELLLGPIVFQELVHHALDQL